MGDLRFSVPNVEDYDPRIWETAYITGIEGIPWLCHHSFDGQQFSIGREIEESGKLNIVWPTACMGNLCLCTTSLRISDEPYSLVVELARGTVYRLKAQTAEWQRIGLKLPDDFFALAESSLCELLHSLTSGGQSDSQQLRAQAAIDQAVEASVALSEAFSAQALDARRNNEGRLATLLGARVDADASLPSVGDAINTAFNLVSLPADLGTVESESGAKQYAAFDAQVSWAEQSDHKICVGPLVDFRRGRLPQWMVLLEQGFESILQTACEHARVTVERYLGKAHLWNCAAGLNVPGDMAWTDEEILRMAVSLIETVRRADQRSPVLLTIDQPWSEYLRDKDHGISPLHFADALIRADLGLSGLALEMNFDSWPGGSFPRDPTEVSRLIDRWSMLGLPIMVILSSPTSHPTNPPTASADSSRVSQWKMPPPATAQTSAAQFQPDTIIRLLMSKPSVHAIIWNGLNDERPAHQPGHGLWNAQGQAKPILAELAKLRKNFLH